jgi:hypothetical protein
MRLRLAIGLIFALGWGAGALAAERWAPRPGMLFDIQFSAPLNLQRAVQFIDLDLFETTRARVDALRARGTYVACYLNAGAWENWRPDKGAFPAQVLGKAYDGWPGERWLDIRRIDLLAPIMRKRLDQCRSKGFHAVEPDNINGSRTRPAFR